VTERLRLIMVSVLQAIARVFSATITVAAFVPLFTMQGVEVRSSADGAYVRLRARWSTDCDFTITRFWRRFWFRST